MFSGQPTVVQGKTLNSGRKRGTAVSNVHEGQPVTAFCSSVCHHRKRTPKRVGDCVDDVVGRVVDNAHSPDSTAPHITAYVNATKRRTEKQTTA